MCFFVVLGANIISLCDIDFYEGSHSVLWKLRIQFYTDLYFRFIPVFKRLLIYIIPLL